MVKQGVIPDDLTKPFWDAANEERLVIQNCTACDRLQHPPVATCRQCGSGDNLEWKGMSGRAKIYNYTVVYDTPIRMLQEDQPFNLAVVIWSIAGILHVFGRGLWSFFSLRILLGLGEAANFPAALKGVAEWFPRAERSMAVGILTVGPGLGSVLAPPLLGALIYYLGWQAAFIVPGVLGFAWMLWWRRMYHLPAVHPLLSRRELDLIVAGQEESAAESVPGRLTDFLRYREIWGLMLSRFIGDGAFYFFVFWLPLYLSSERGFNIMDIALFAWIPFLALDFGALAGGGGFCQGKTI